MEDESVPLMPYEEYQSNKVHIGTQTKSKDMQRFIREVADDGTGLHLIDIEQTDERLQLASNFLGMYEARDILVVSARQYGQRPARLFAQAIGARHIVGRFIPGTLTNPLLRTYIEPQIIFVTDPQADNQALSEAISSNMPVVGICDTNNNLRNVDLCIPANNKGRRSLALIYWLLAREVLKARGVLDDETWQHTQKIEDWESSF
ncbi:MAG: 30S ribosomal protein S2 [Candidatus Poseidoniales archaeon]|nr:30S ribosomal protein S2 [Candidatus Poseidoniales archaeon]